MSEQEIGTITIIDQQVVDGLENKEVNSLVGTVHSVFNKVINILATDQSSLLTLALEEVISSPGMMKTADKQLFNAMKSKVAPGDPVRLSQKNTIKIKQVEWDYTKATYSLVKISKKNLSERLSSDSFSKTIYKFIKEQGSDSGLVSAWEIYSNKELANSSVKNSYVAFFLQAIRKMSEELAAKDFNAVVKQSYKLVGLGVGLTPSGDDFLLGCLAVWHLFESPLIESFEGNNWIEHVKKRSTSISAFMLENGVNGYVNQALNDLLRHYQEEDITRYLQPFLKIGATSGTDMLVGVIFAYDQMNNSYRR
ncbi:Protein of unknown function [Carnobacterium iners]|uniref:DUF2877 domain-containing protein n=1 Tax=Carnobacterium iners TaxID=1073423 RepID=A0A1X7MQX7_9LACT|nr:DUF2877 domain-containing protein [Carnobacterium iners]SEL09045.1 Protein of unknown function [Carnobacterium iners]SMH26527.1 Protein of unknown function [Carnobacterium iners]